METIYDRTAMLIGVAAVEQLKKKAVLLFGIGGVGGFTAEALARTGIGTIGLVDCDCVDVTNMNRQIIALQDTVGQPKTQIMRERIFNINPDITVRTFQTRLTAENIEDFALGEYDYIIDAIDDVTAKLTLIEAAERVGVPILSCMGTGNKLDPQRLRIVPIEKTHTCPLARVIRKELSQRGIKGISVVFSDEPPAKAEESPEGRRVPASAVFVPACAGMLLASQAVRDLIS